VLPKELRLHRHITDLIEQERAPLGRFDFALRSLAPVNAPRS
jgi:hypothetical protein